MRSEEVSTSTGNDFGRIIKINDAQVKKQLGELVRGTVQETLNELLDQVV